MVQIWIKSLTFNDGTNLELSQNEIIVIVGPNNAGKSSTLRESAQLLRAKSNKGKIISDLVIGKEGNEEQLLQHLEKIGQKVFVGNPLPSYRGFGFDIYESNAIGYWNSINETGFRS